MAVFRVEKNKNYTTMSNYHFKDKRLSLKAKGLLSEMLSLPDDWNYSVAGLVAINKEKEDTIKSTLKELKDAGYLVVNKILPSKENGGKITYEYVIYETPMKRDEQEGENQHLDCQVTEVQPAENSTLLNTNIVNTKELNTDVLNLEKEINKEREIVEKPKRKKFVPPTLEEVKAYCLEKDLSVNAERFLEYYQAGDWKDAKGNNVKSWKQKLLTWEGRNNDNTPKYISNSRSKSTGNPFGDMLKQEGYNVEDILYGESGNTNFIE